MATITRTIMVYGYETNTGYRETWARPATKKEMREWGAKLVYQGERKYQMDLETFILNAQEVLDEN